MLKSPCFILVDCQVFKWIPAFLLQAERMLLQPYASLQHIIITNQNLIDPWVDTNHWLVGSLHWPPTLMSMLFVLLLPGPTSQVTKMDLTVCTTCFTCSNVQWSQLSNQSQETIPEGIPSWGSYSKCPTSPLFTPNTRTPLFNPCISLLSCVPFS